jgi:medium-chain acyl-[acyl-carrier-protein] hydrolase
MEINAQFTCLRRNPNTRLRFFCIPYAGGNAAAFRGWPDGLPEAIEVWAVQPPGRGVRLGEMVYSRIEPFIRDLSEAMALILDLPYALFGHSFGALPANLAGALTAITRARSA